MGVGLLLASRATELWQIYLTYSLSIGIGVGLIYVPSVGTVQHWFIRKRGTASGIGTAGIGAGNLMMPPIATGLIALTDWRLAYVILALGVIMLGLVAGFLMENSPQQRGLLPDGEPVSSLEEAARREVHSRPVSGATLKQAVTSRPFWLLYFGAMLVAFGVFIPFVHMAPYARDKGLGEAGVWLIGLIGVGSTFGRLLIGGLADRMGRRRTMAAAFIGVTVMMVWWLFSDSLWMLVIFSLVFGLCYGSFVALSPALTADYYGRRNVSTILGFQYTSVAGGTLLGPTLAGVAFDLTNSYAVPILGSAIAGVIAVICMLVLPPTENYKF
jgi:MFS family permease